MKTSIIIHNLKCGGCVNTIKSELISLKGITDVSVDSDTSKVSFSYQDMNDALVAKDKLKALGYLPVDRKNSMASKARSFVSCATGRISK